MEPVYAAAERVLAPFLRRWFRWEMEGMEHLREGPLIVACNHVSFLDPFCSAYALHCAGRRARFLAKAELFRNPFLRFLLVRLGQIPVQRREGVSSSAARSLELAEAAVWRGRDVVIFPEGTIGPGLPLLPLKTGAARLSIATGVPITPLATWGGQAVFPKGAKPRPARGELMKVLVGEPISPPGAVASEERVEALTKDLSHRLTELVEKSSR